ncbi:DUF551 domain-containing protein [Acinetobacter johnsonii]|uniref:DUF551 domain-containing protein n=1 Tax=Acinetobacter johnsonii TaxID=40214 RepID=UPI003AF55A12
MDVEKEREAFQKFCEENFDFERHEQTYFDEQTQCYENDIGEDTESINMAWSAWQAAKAQAVQGWISVEDGLPAKFGMRVRIKRNWWDEDDNDVVVESEATFDKDSDFCELSHKTYEYETWFDHQLNKYLDEGYVTHWMPLPDAPQEPAND